MGIDTSQFDNQLKVMMNNAEKDGMDWSQMFGFIKNMTTMYEEMLVHPEFVKIKNEKFDLIVLGWFMNDFHIGLAAHFKVPAVVTLNSKATAFVRNYVGMSQGTSYNPSQFLGYQGVMTFRERVINFFAVSAENLFSYGFDYFWHEPHYAKNFPSDKYVSFDEARKNISLVLVNHHFSQGAMEAYLPNMVEVGGMHIKSEPNPLPKVMDKEKCVTNYSLFYHNIFLE